MEQKRNKKDEINPPDAARKRSKKDEINQPDVADNYRQVIPRFEPRETQTLKDNVPGFNRLFVLIVVNGDIMKDETLIQRTLMEVLSNLINSQLEMLFLSFLDSDVVNLFWRTRIPSVDTFKYMRLSLCDKLKLVGNHWNLLGHRTPVALYDGYRKIMLIPPSLITLKIKS